MRRAVLAFVFGALGCAGMPAPTATVMVGAVVEGRLSEDDHRANDGSAVDVYAISLEAGQTITILVRRGFSRDYPGGFLDPYVYVFDESQTQLAEDDDSGEGLDARLIFTAPARGRYGVVVTTYETGLHRGQYTLLVLDGAQPDAV